jgi:hypothetical protein
LERLSAGETVGSGCMTEECPVCSDKPDIRDSIYFRY